MPSLGVVATASKVRVSANVILSRDNKFLWAGWTHPAHKNLESSLPKSSYTRVATIEPSLVVIQ